MNTRTWNMGHYSAAALLCVPLLLVSLAGLADTASTDNGSSTAQTISDPLVQAHHIRFGRPELRTRALKLAIQNKDTAMIAPMLYTMIRLDTSGRREIARALRAITGENYGDNWFRWSQYNQREQIKTIDEFDEFLFNELRLIDPDFRRFIYPGVDHRVPLQEVLWGGVAAVDGIPPLDHPPLVEAVEADYLSGSEQVFGIKIGDDVRAYPYRFMDWHEMLNDTIADKPISLAYCTLCGSGILFDTSNTTGHYKFGSSGLLFRSNKLMFDHTTNSLWNQFTGEPVIGELARSGKRLPQLPLVTTTWERWRQANPSTLVMSGETGHERDYRPGAPYEDYFKDPQLMFPALTDDRQLAQKAKVFALRVSGANKAWSLNKFRRGRVINDTIGVLPVVLIGHKASGEVRAYRRGKFTFKKIKGTLSQITAEGTIWQVTEHELVGPEGVRLSRLPGHIAYWFAWHNFVGSEYLAE
ncbi:MAG: DUF3179 domain-containing protein [Pseudomonadota bacterium]